MNLHVQLYALSNVRHDKNIPYNNAACRFSASVYCCATAQQCCALPGSSSKRPESE
jgi:hypothetical protein